MGKYEEFVEAYKKQDELGLKTNKELYTYLGLTPVTYNNYKTKYLKTVGDYDSQTWLDEKTRHVDAQLIKACEKGSPQALQTFYKLNQRLIDRKEETVKVEFTISDRQKLTADIINGLREDSRITGVCAICGLSQALCDDSLLLAEPEHASDRAVEAVEVPA